MHFPTQVRIENWIQSSLTFSTSHQFGTLKQLSRNFPAIKKIKIKKSLSHHSCSLSHVSVKRTAVFWFQSRRSWGRRRAPLNAILSALRITRMNRALISHDWPDLCDITQRLSSVQGHNQSSCGPPLSMEKTISRYKAETHSCAPEADNVALLEKNPHFNSGVPVLFYLCMTALLRIYGLFVDNPRLKGYNASLCLIIKQRIGFWLNTPGVNLLQLS